MPASSTTTATSGRCATTSSSATSDCSQAAGNETTTRLIGWTAYLLDRFPDQRRLLAEDRSLVPNAIEEILRYEAPSPVQARYVTRDVELHGTRVPEGSTLLLLNGSANRDEREFEDADRLDVKRRNIHHLSFGYGIHFCLGASLARLEGRVALEEILARWTEWEIDHEGPRWRARRRCAVGRGCRPGSSRVDRTTMFLAPGRL